MDYNVGGLESRVLREGGCTYGVVQDVYCYHTRYKYYTDHTNTASVTPSVPLGCCYMAVLSPLIFPRVAALASS